MKYSIFLISQKFLHLLLIYLAVIPMLIKHQLMRPYMELQPHYLNYRAKIQYLNSSRIRLNFQIVNIWKKLILKKYCVFFHTNDQHDNAEKSNRTHLTEGSKIFVKQSVTPLIKLSKNVAILILIIFWKTMVK